MNEEKTQKIETLVREILSLAPELKEKEHDLRRLVELLLETKPNVSIDSAFVEELRGKLQSSIRAQEAIRSNAPQKRSIVDIFNNKFAYTFVAIFFLVLITSPFLKTGAPSIHDASSGKLAFAPTVKDVDEMAFGDLAAEAVTDTSQGLAKSAVTPTQERSVAALDTASNNVGSEQALGKASMMAPATVTREGVGGEESAPSPVIAPDGGTVSGMGGGSVGMPAYYEMIYPKYVFGGTLPDIPQKSAVYKRVAGSLKSSELDDTLRSLDLGLIDLGTFGNANVQRLEIASKEDPAYTVSVDLVAGNISIYRVQTGVYYPEGRPFDGVNLDEESLIKTAHTFLEKHSVDLSSYGEPYVFIPEYMTMMKGAEPSLGSDAAKSSLSSFAPIYAVQVRYPLIISGMKVVDQSGYAIGIDVSINVSGKYVENVWGLETQTYERSQYPLIQDVEKIIRLAEKGGYGYMYYDNDQNVKMVDVNLNTPELVLMKYSKWSSKTNNSEDLLVPSLMFTADKKSAESLGVYVNNYVVVPLVEGIIQENIYAVPMPMGDVHVSPDSVVVPSR